MKRGWNIVFLMIVAFVLVSLNARGQQIPGKADSVNTDSVKVKKAVRHETGLFVGIQAENGNQPDGRGNVVTYSAGIEFDRFIAGAYSTVFSGEISQMLIFPNTYRLIYSHGGVYFGRRIYQTKRLETEVLFNWGKGNMLWERSDTYADFIEDRFLTYKPEILVAFKPILPLRIFGSLGYRTVRGLELSGVEKKNFEGFTVNLGFRIGFYRQKR